MKTPRKKQAKGLNLERVKALLRDSLPKAVEPAPPVPAALRRLLTGR